MAISPAFIHSNQLSLVQQTYLSAGLQSIKSWFEVFFTIAPSAYVGFSFPIISQLVRCMFTISRLTTLETLSWDENCVWKKSDAFSVLDRVVNNLEQVQAVAQLENTEFPGGDVFSSTARMFRSLRSGWEASWGTDAMSTVPFGQNVEDAFPTDGMPGEGFDNDWLMDLLLSQNYKST